MIHRRHFLGLLGASIAAPAIVRASSIMPVRALATHWTHNEIALGYSICHEEFAFGFYDWRGAFGTFEERMIRQSKTVLGRPPTPLAGTILRTSEVVAKNIITKDELLKLAREQVDAHDLPLL